QERRRFVEQGAADEMAEERGIFERGQQINERSRRAGHEVTLRRAVREEGAREQQVLEPSRLHDLRAFVRTFRLFLLTIISIHRPLLACATQ
ncbi:MAG TPA: hypothetical protein VHZ95_00945, partial [Polyangiales bacterium]|nr:hypothetical protein [Polyangiales bacterium]